MAQPMDPVRFGRVKELFGKASSLPGAERARYLASSCGQDSALRQEVEELLAHADQAKEGFLSGTARVPVPPAGNAQVPIPGFRLQKLLAAGASGLVYHAEQERPRREVAVKLLRLDTLWPGQVERFQREAEILAQLAHAGIAHVFGAGVVESEAGRLPWIAMELVRGRELTKWIELEQPDLRRRVELFVALCEAVQHAHERGVVHRDLKPSNVLVQVDDRPKVIDFGIARADLDERATSERTRAGLVMGTVAYMAPEQARGEQGAVGQASDVYALGVMLFEALTGELPLDLEAADVIEGARIVCEVEPHRLRALRPELSSDLETILIKALDKDPLRRYVCAGALGSDLANWLADRPVLARRPTITYQLRKFVIRNRALSVGSAVVISSLLLALLQAQGRLASERRGNERMSALTEALSSKYFGLSERLGFGDQDRSDAADLIALIEGQLVLDPGYRPLRVLLAQALNDLGNLHQGSRAQVEAAACYRRAMELCEELVAEDPEDRESLSHLSRLYAKLGECARDQGDLEQRDRWFAAALAHDEDLVQRFPDDLELREDLDWSLERVANAAFERGDSATALRLRLRRLADAEELVRLQPDNWKFVRNLAHTHFFLVGCDSRSDHLAECLRLASREVELRPGARESLVWLAQAHRAVRKYAPDLESELEPAMAAFDIAMRLVREDPSHAEHLELLRLAGLEALTVAEQLDREATVQQMLQSIREQISISAAQRGLENYARLMDSDVALWEARNIEADGRHEEANALEARAWEGLHTAALADPVAPSDLVLCRDILSNACFAALPSPPGPITRFFEPLLATGGLDRASWFADELTTSGHLPPSALEELAALRRARGF